MLQKTTSTTDAQGYTHLTIITKFGAVEYINPDRDPSRFINTSIGVTIVVVDPDGALVRVSLRGVGTATDVDGNVLYRGTSLFDFVIEDGEPVGYVSRGPLGPCVPGID